MLETKDTAISIFLIFDEDYLHLDSHTLELRCKIVNSDGTDLNADAKVGFINHPLHAMFSQVDVSLNETLITVASNKC